MSANTTTPTPEFSRLFPSPKDGARISISESARKTECAALAERFGVLAVRSFSVSAKLTAEAGGASLKGEVFAHMTQRCVVTMDPVETRLKERIERRFLPEHRIEPEEDFDPEGEDPPEPLTDEIDVGEIAAEAAALAIDPYPRAEGVEIETLTAAPPGAAPLTDEAVKPFAGLAELKRKLESQNGGDD